MDTVLLCLHNTMVINTINAIRVRTWHANVPTGCGYHLAPMDITTRAVKPLVI